MVKTAQTWFGYLICLFCFDPEVIYVTFLTHTVVLPCLQQYMSCRFAGKHTDSALPGFCCSSLEGFGSFRHKV